ncbi:MAG: allantoinase [Deltaproteobacteria bacterium RBG_16_48_10]|nr:MAG: allantoinase [Deltaproteobacteria bacterium RBG_16_48_10]
MKPNLLIANGILVTFGSMVQADLAIQGEKIAGIFSPGMKHQAEEVIDAKGMLVLPGVIDSHVHFNEPGRETWEGFETGSKSAAAGGITTFIDMPLNSSPCTVNGSELKRKIERGQKHSVVDFGLWGGATPENMDHLEELDQGGVLGFKAFMSNSGIDEFKHIQDGELVEILNRLGKMNQVLGLHAENEAITSHLSKTLKSMGRTDRKAYLESRPPLAEEEAVHRALFIAKHSMSGTSLHFLHTTLSRNMEAIDQARKTGLKVTVETCPHYLTLADKDFLDLGPVGKCAPPLRSEQEVEALWKSVFNGLVDVIGSDHSPCTLAEKEEGNDNIWEAWGGISGIQAMLPILFSEGVVKRKLSPSSLVRMLSFNPAKLFGLYPRKGVLQPGSDADIVLLDPEKRWVIDKEGLFYRNKHSPFIGRTVTGAVVYTIVRGRVVYRKGEIIVSPGTGRFLPRQHSQKTGNGRP